MKQFFTLLFIFSAASIYAQAPVNDDCAGLIDLGVGENCSEDDIYDNIDATATDIGFEDSPFCSPDGEAPRDVWFAFTAPSTAPLDFTVSVFGVEGENGEAPIVNPQIAIYRGACQMDGLSLVACASEIEGDTLVDVDVLGLTPNLQYYIRVSDYAAGGGDNSGAFRICIEEFMPIFTVDEIGTNLCEGFLYDTGGPDDDYGSNEDHTFTICPTIPPACINFTLQFYNIEYQFGDNLSIYDGDSPGTGTLLANFNGGDATPVTEDPSSGAVCFQTQASSGCLTVVFSSDASVEFEGFAASWSCSLSPCEMLSVIDIDNNISTDDIETTLTSPASVVTLTDLDCAEGAYGSFSNGDDTDLGIGEGIILTTGTANNAIGPNNSGSTGTNNGFDGDFDLDALSNIVGDSTASQDACILELDIFANTNELSFEYVFGSEEYREFVNSNFNDIFTFLISGPGIVGDPVLGGQQNIAVIPGSNDLVQINSVNDEQNWQYFRNNEFGVSIEYDGLTSDSLGIKKSLTARADVTPCQTYHLKLAIADRQDGIYDSGVFIGEIRGGAPDVVFESASGLDYVIEDCDLLPDTIILRLDDAPTDTLNYQVVFGGTAINGEDYILDIPGQITFGPNQTEYAFPIEVLSDLIMEGTETIELRLFRDFGCGSVEVALLEIELREIVDINIELDRDTILACFQDTFSISATGAQEYLWSPADVVVDSAGLATVNVSLEESGFVYVTGFVGLGCQGTDSVYVDVVDPSITIDQSSPVAICSGDSALLSLSSNIDLSLPGVDIDWTPAFSVDNPDSAMIFADPFFTTLYTASLTIGGCTVTDTITVDVNTLRTPDLIEDVTICQNFSTPLTTNTFFFFNDQNIYIWDPEDGLDDPTIPQPTATPEVTTTYTLISTVANGACADTLSTTVTVIPANVDIIQEDTLLLCNGDELELTAVTSTGNANNLVWTSSNNLLNEENTLNVSLIPDRSGTYYATLTVADCIVTDSVIAFVDSIPANLAIMADPEQDTYCEGDEVILTSEIYDPADFPRISHQWVQGGPGYQTGDSLYNMVLNVVDTFNYTRVTISGGCVDSASIQIDVIPLAELIVDPADTSICLGEELTLSVSYDGEGDVTWEPDVGCSGADCLEVTVAPTITTTYTLMAENEGCPVETTAQVAVIQPPNPNVPAQIGACEGEPRTLAISQPEAGVTYLWTSPDLPGFSSDDLNVVVTLDADATFNLVASNECFTVERSIAVMIVPQPAPSVIADTSTCAGESVTLSDATPQDLVDYSWTLNGVEISTELNLTVTPTETSVYRLRASNDCGEVNLIVVLTVTPVPTLDLNDAQLCPDGSSVVLNDIAAEDGVTYTWTSDPNDPAIVQGAVSQTVSPAQTTTYTVTATTDDDCFMETASATVLVFTEPTVSLPAPFDICPNTPVTIEADVMADDGVNLLYTWILNGEVQDDETGSTFSPENLGTGGNQIQVEVTYGDDCGTVTATTIVTVVSTDFDFFIEQDPDSTFFPGDVVTLTAVADPAPGLMFDYLWTRDGETIPGATGPVITETISVPDNADPGSEVTIDYDVTVTFGPGCTDMASVVIAVMIPDSDLPNVFTPNGDGTNDRFRIFSNVVPDIISMKVFNRWGQVVYEGTDPAGWDGTYKGEAAPSDVYIYQIAYELRGVPFEAEGEVTLVR